MTHDRLEQLRRIEQLACDACAAHTALEACIERPKDWHAFDQCVRNLKAKLDTLREACTGRLEVAAPEPLSVRPEPKQTRIEGT